MCNTFSMTSFWLLIAKCTNYFDKFCLLTHTNQQNVYFVFDNFYCDNATREGKNVQHAFLGLRIYRRANKTCHIIKTCHGKLARL